MHPRRHSLPHAPRHQPRRLKPGRSTDTHHGPRALLRCESRRLLHATPMLAFEGTRRPRRRWLRSGFAWPSLGAVAGEAGGGGRRCWWRRIRVSPGRRVRATQRGNGGGGGVVCLVADYPFHMEANRNSFPQSDEDPNHRHAKDTVGSTHSKEDVAPKEARLNDDSLNDNQEYSADVAKRWPHQKKGETKTSRLANKSGMPTKTILKTKIPMTGTPSKLLGQKLPGNFIDSNAPSRVYSHKVKKFTQPSHTCNQDDSLPGIESFQIVGNPRPGSTLRACGFPSDGTVLCNFQWVRFLEHYYLQYIEGATMYDYVVTVDDVGALLAVDCIPMDDNGREVVNKDSLAGHLVREFANNKNIIKCDLEMQNDINIHISRGRTEFDVFLMKMHFPEGWEQATLVLTQTGYQVILQDEVLIDEKYSPNVQLKIPRGQTTEFDLVRPSGVNLAFNTWKITGGNTYDNDIRLRNLIVLVMRAFQNKASMSPSVPRKKDAINSVAKTINIDDLPSHTIAEPPALTSNKKRWISSFFIRKRPGCVKLAMQIDGY